MNPFDASLHLHPLSSLFQLTFPPTLPFSAIFLLDLPPILLTSGDDALQPDDVGVVELPQDAGFAEEGAALFVGAAGP